MSIFGHEIVFIFGFQGRSPHSKWESEKGCQMHRKGKGKDRKRKEENGRKEEGMEGKGRVGKEREGHERKGKERKANGRERKGRLRLHAQLHEKFNSTQNHSTGKVAGCVEVDGAK